MPSKESGLSSEASGELMKVVEKRDAVIRSSCSAGAQCGQGTGGHLHQPHAPCSDVPLKKSSFGLHADGLSAASAVILSPRGAL